MKKTNVDVEFEKRVERKIAHIKQMKEWKKQNLKTKEPIEIDCFHCLTLEQLKQCLKWAEEDHEGAEVYWKEYIKQVEPYFKGGK